MDLVTYAVLSKKIDAIGNIPDEKITEAVNTYLNENPPVTGATAEQAAQIDKNVADIGELKGDIDKLNEGGLNLKDEVIAEDINKWLNEHPEVTTTVQDGSINEDKFTNALRKKKANYYISVKKMKEDVSLVVDTVCVTLGYYEPNDGGGATYRVREKKTTDVDNGGSIHILTNDFVAELIVGDCINAKSFGLMSGNISFDNSAIFTVLINFANARRKDVVVPYGSYYFMTPIKFNNIEGIKIHGSGVVDFYFLGNDEYFITIDSLVESRFSDIKFIMTDKNYGVCVGKDNGSVFRSFFTKCQFINGIVAFSILNSAYFYLENCAFIIQNMFEDNARLLITGGEYIYINECSIEGSNSKGNGIVVNAGNFIYITRCDIPNFKGVYSDSVLSNGYSVLLETNVTSITDISNVYMKDNSFMRSIRPVGIISSPSPSVRIVRDIYVDNSFVSTADCGHSMFGCCLYIKNGISNVSVHMKNTHIRDYGNRTRPTNYYIMEGVAYDVSISDDNTVCSSMVGSFNKYENLYTAKNGRFPNLSAVPMISETVDAYGIKVDNNDVRIIKSENCPSVIRMNLSDAILSDIKGGYVGRKIVVVATQQFTIKSKDTFCVNVSSDKIVGVGETAIFEKVALPNAWIVY